MKTFLQIKPSKCILLTLVLLSSISLFSSCSFGKKQESTEYDPELEYKKELDADTSFQYVKNKILEINSYEDKRYAGPTEDLISSKQFYYCIHHYIKSEVQQNICWSFLQMEQHSAPYIHEEKTQTGSSLYYISIYTDDDVAQLQIFMNPDYGMFIKLYVGGDEVEFGWDDPSKFRVEHPWTVGTYKNEFKEPICSYAERVFDGNSDELFKIKIRMCLQEGLSFTRVDSDGDPSPFTNKPVLKLKLIDGQVLTFNQKNGCSVLINGRDLSTVTSLFLRHNVDLMAMTDNSLSGCQPAKDVNLYGALLALYPKRLDEVFIAMRNNPKLDVFSAFLQ